MVEWIQHSSHAHEVRSRLREWKFDFQMAEFLLSSIVRTYNNHAALHITLLEHERCDKPFRFYSSWLWLSSLNDIFIEAWKITIMDSPLYIRQQKLKFAKITIKAWALTNSNLSLKVEKLLQKREFLDAQQWARQLAHLRWLIDNFFWVSSENSPGTKLYSMHSQFWMGTNYMPLGNEISSNDTFHTSIWMQSMSMIDRWPKHTHWHNSKPWSKCMAMLFPPWIWNKGHFFLWDEQIAGN